MAMKRVWVLMLVLVVAFFIAGCGKSKEEGTPKGGMAQEFSATVVSTGGGQTVATKMYFKAGKLRTEVQAAPGTYTIARPDLEKVWMVMTANRSYMEMPFKKDQESGIPAEKMRGEVSRKTVGTETIDGHPTTKYEVTVKTGDKTSSLYHWWATDINFPVKTAAVDGSMSVTYKDIKIGGQADSLFELPAGYTKMSLPGLPGKK